MTMTTAPRMTAMPTMPAVESATMPAVAPMECMPTMEAASMERVASVKAAEAMTSFCSRSAQDERHNERSNYSKTRVGGRYDLDPIDFELSGGTGNSAAAHAIAQIHF
jgi:hypothetical protein